ncbi:PREDICTED: uncharacterized protein LOC101310148 [Fragaria vesca subsp. vesca]
MTDFRGRHSHHPGSSSGTAGSFMDPAMDIIHDVFPSCPRYEETNYDTTNNTTDYEKYNRLLVQAHTTLYPGSDKTVLGVILSLMQFKVKNRLSNTGFDEILALIKDMLPVGNNLPDCYYKVRRILNDLGLGYKKIHACKNNCILFYGDDNKFLDICPVCKESRYKPSPSSKGKNVPWKVLRYFPLIPRLKRLYMSSRTAKKMRWHGRKRTDDDTLRHPADGEAWKSFDRLFPDFAADFRNVRLGLATDGFNPFGNMSLSHSTWPVIVFPYNLPPEMCMKKEYNMLTLLIPGPQSPGKCLDVYMRPLIDELNELWEYGVSTFDRYSQTFFKMRAVVMWTISDFPAYGMLSSHVTKGYKACPVCGDDIHSSWHAGKVCYLGSRRSLDEDHEWRQDAENFDGSQEFLPKPREWSGDQILEYLNGIDFGQKSSDPKVVANNPKQPDESGNWTGKSIFFELPYWSKLRIRHNLDVMHIEKNVCDSVLGTILNIKEKTKDTIKERLDLEHMKIRPHLWLTQDGSTLKMPLAPYCVKPTLKKNVFSWFHGVSYPHGYAGNISRCVKVAENKILGLKSHDCHVLLQRLLPVVIRPYLHPDVVEVLVALSRFFQKLCTRELKKSDVLRMKEEIVFILCKMERIFSPAFFDIMIHLIERQLGGYKKYVRNRSNPEGSIAEAYLAHECVTYCNSYIFNKDDDTVVDNTTDATNAPQFNLSVVSELVKPFGNVPYTERLTNVELIEAHWYVLQNCAEVNEYREYHLDHITDAYPNRHEERHKKEFPNYFLEWMFTLQQRGDARYNPELHNLACKPQAHHVSAACFVNSVKFVTLQRDEGRKTQNYGVMAQGESDQPYYRVLLTVVELLYGNRMPIVLFKCKWFITDPNVSTSTKMDHGLLSVNTNTSWYENDPFILATQAKQVFYLDDPNGGAGWKVVNVMSHRNIYSAATLGLGVERDDHHEVDEPYQEESTSEIPDTEDIRINNDVYFEQGELEPISELEIELAFASQVPPTEDFIDDQYEDSDASQEDDDVEDDDSDDEDYDDSD